MYNSHEYLLYESWVIWSQNTKVMAKKQISMQGVTQNSTDVSCNHPNSFYVVSNCFKIHYDIWIIIQEFLHKT